MNDPPPALGLEPVDEPRTRQDSVTEIIVQTQVSLRTDSGAGRRRSVMAALTKGALWLQDTWQLQQVPLTTLASIETRRRGKQLVLTLRPEFSAGSLKLTFADSTEGERWQRELQTGQQAATAEASGPPPHQLRLPEGVALVRQAPDVPHAGLGRVEVMEQNLWKADRGLQLQAAIRGADAVIDLERCKCPDLGASARQVSGLAIRVDDAAARQQLRLRWYAEEVCALINRILLFLGLLAVLLFIVAVFCAGRTRFHPATGETFLEALASTGLGMALLFAWPLALLALLRLLRWPQLLRIVGIAVLVASAGRTLAVWLAFLAAARTAGARLDGSHLWILADPVDWAFVLAGAALCLRSWRLAADARQILPEEVRRPWAARKAWTRGLAALTGTYALVLLGFAGHYQYQASAHLLQPGVDPRREQQALLAFNEGAALAEKGQLEAAEQSWQRSLRLWEELTAGRSVLALYRANLATTLNNLGWVCERRGHPDEAQKYYARAVALADELGSDPQLDDEFKETLAGAREALAGLRSGRLFKQLNDKDQAAARKYEDAQVKADKGDIQAEHLFQEAIALWEEVLPQADNPGYRKGTVPQLAVAYLHLAELQRQQGKRFDSEASLKKAIDYGEKAVALDPDRPLPRHNLEVARRQLDELHELAFQEQVNKLCDAQRFADAVEVCLQGIDQQEEQVRSGRDHEAAVRRLAYRLDRFAWFLAHCPDERVRDAKAAVKRARRATELQPDVADYWYTLAMVQYRNGDWRDSLASLDRVQARESGFDGSDWLLVAMNRHQLKQTAEARAALRRAIAWIEEQQRKAEGNALLRFQYEMARPALDALRREAENLIEARDPAGDRIGRLEWGAGRCRPLDAAS